MSGSYGEIAIWNPQDGTRLRTLEGQSGSVSALAISPDGQTLASTVYDGRTISLLGAESGRIVRQLEGHGDNVNSLAFSPDGRMLASASDDKTVRLWDVGTGEVVATMVGYDGGAAASIYDGVLWTSSRTADAFISVRRPDGSQLPLVEHERKAAVEPVEQDAAQPRREPAVSAEPAAAFAECERLIGGNEAGRYLLEYADVEAIWGIGAALAPCPRAAEAGDARAARYTGLILASLGATPETVSEWFERAVEGGDVVMRFGKPGAGLAQWQDLLRAAEEGDEEAAFWVHVTRAELGPMRVPVDSLDEPPLNVRVEAARRMLARQAERGEPDRDAAPPRSVREGGPRGGGEALGRKVDRRTAGPRRHGRCHRGVPPGYDPCASRRGHARSGQGTGYGGGGPLASPSGRERAYGCRLQARHRL